MRPMAQIAGFHSLNRHGSPGPVSQEELMEQGVQGHALLVRIHQEEVLMRSFRCWILWFSGLVCLLMPVMIGILLWLLAEYIIYRETECDVPLLTWCDVVYAVVLYNSTINRPTPRGSLVVRFCCFWERDPQNPAPMPLRARLYNAMVTLAIFAWNCVGLHWVHVSGSFAEDGPPSCKEVAPGLYYAVEVYAVFNMTFTVFMYLNMVGVAHLLRVAMRRGLLRTSNAAPKGALEKNTTPVDADDPLLIEQTSCSICFEDFSDVKQRQPLKTNACRHLFCKTCLEGWLKVNRNCPLCRHDLGDLGADRSAGT